VGLESFSHLTTIPRLPITDSLEHQFKFCRLNFAQQLSLWIGIGPASGPFAGIDKGEWIPFAAGNQFGQKRVFPFALEDGSGPASKLREARMFADAVEPVFGIAIIRFAPMEDGV